MKSCRRMVQECGIPNNWLAIAHYLNKMMALIRNVCRKNNKISKKSSINEVRIIH